MSPAQSGESAGWFIVFCASSICSLRPTGLLIWDIHLLIWDIGRLPATGPGETSAPEPRHPRAWSGRAQAPPGASAQSAVMGA